MMSGRRRFLRCAHIIRAALRRQPRYLPLLGDDIAGQERIAVRKISDDEFEIDLPVWFK